jgi:hypothetical protein
MILVPLAIGWILGGIMTSNAGINNAIDDADLLYKDFKAVGDSLQSVEGALDMAKDRGKGKLLDNDAELTAALDALKLQAPNTDTLFKANMQYFSKDVQPKIVAFYQGVTDLYAKIKTHQRLAKGDERKAAPKPKNVGQYAAVLRVPSGDKASPYVEVVEVGAPICAGETKVNQEGCSADKPPEKFQVRTDPGGTWQILGFAKDAAGVGADAILFIGDNGVKSAFLSGAQEFVDTVGYRQRIREIDEQVRDLSQQRANVQNLLTLEKQKSKKFAL